mgnify:FL=1
MRRRLWEYKPGAEIEGNFMRRLWSKSTKSSKYKHRVVFQYHGDPPESWWEEWERIAKQPHIRGTVKLFDYRNHGLGGKRKRKVVLRCKDCGEEVPKLVQGHCLNCSNKIKAASQKDKEVQANIEEDHSHALVKAANVVKELKTTNDGLSLECRQLLATVKQTNRKIVEQNLRNEKDLRKVLKEQNKNAQQMQSRLGESFLSYISSSNKFQQEQDLVKADLHALQQKVKQNTDKISHYSQSVEKLINAKRADIDIADGLFAKAFMMDLYNVGIFPCSSKSRGYGTSSCRRGNVALYHRILKPAMDRILGVCIPIVDHVEQGKRIFHEELGMRLKLYGHDLNFGTIDIVYKGRLSLRKKDEVGVLYKHLYVWYKADRASTGLYETAKGLAYTRAQFKENMKDTLFFCEMFCTLFWYHLKHGMTQAHDSEYRNDYSKFEFYHNESILVSLTKERDHLHLHTFSKTRRFYYEEPKLHRDDD